MRALRPSFCDVRYGRLSSFGDKFEPALLISPIVIFQQSGRRNGTEFDGGFLSLMKQPA